MKPSSCAGSTSEGASIMRSVALAVFGKAMTSRIDLRAGHDGHHPTSPGAIPP